MLTPNRSSWCWKLGLASVAMGGAIATSGNCAVAQIVPDSTLRAERSVVTTNAGNQTVDVISGGATRGANLFHSFEQFSVLNGRTAHFNNAENIHNIISRVTGGRSIIEGIIRANGAANLFLINPNGISFGPNAKLKIGGSFLASTASRMKFADGTEFSATAGPTTPLLTISVPIGLQFQGAAAGISVNGSGLEVQPGKTLALVGGEITLYGGDLAASGGTNLSAPGGRIELGSVAENSLVNLSATDSGWNLGYGGVQNFKDIQLSQGAFVNAPVFEAGGGDVQVQARRLTTQDGAAIAAPTLGSKPGGTLAVRASDSVELSGTASGLPGGLFAQVVNGATGNGGNLTIETRQLRVRDGAEVGAGTFGVGRAGNLTVKASDSIELSGTAPSGPSGLLAQVNQEATGNGGTVTIETGRLLIREGAQVSAGTSGVGRAGNLILRASDSIELIGRTPDGKSPSGLFAQVEEGATGNGGDLSIETGKLTVLDGAQVSTASRSGGQGGTLTINASDSILLSGAIPTPGFLFRRDPGSSGLFVSVEQGGTRNGGELKITTGQLTVQDGAKISADTLGPGQAGNATLNVRQLLIRDGGVVGAGSFDQSGRGGNLSVNAADSVEVSGIRTIGLEKVPSTLSTETQTAGDAGNLNITTGSLIVRDGGKVSVSSTGSGKAGNLEVQARSIQLDNLGKLNGETIFGNGGDITLQVQDLLRLRHGSQISTSAGNEKNGGNGGNITIDPPLIVAVPSENSDIKANALGGTGGKVNITAEGIFGIQKQERDTPQSDITASGGQPTLNGVITINTPNVDPSRGLVVLPAAVVNASGLIAQGCDAGDGTTDSQFIVTGRGGLPPTPDEVLSSDAVWEDARLTAATVNPVRSQSVRATQPSTPAAVPIVPATGWVFNQLGQVTLTASAPAATSYSFGATPTTCRARAHRP